MSRPKYTYLNLSSREVLGNRLASGESIPSIAKAMGVHHTTLYRELKRNSRNIRTRVNKPYQADLDGRRYPMAICLKLRPFLTRGLEKGMVGGTWLDKESYF